MSTTRRRASTATGRQRLPASNTISTNENIKERPNKKLEEELNNLNDTFRLPVYTSDNIDTPIQHLGIVYGEAIFGMFFLKDWVANIQNFVGGYALWHENSLHNAKKRAIRKMIQHALRVHGNSGVHAIVKVNFSVTELKHGLLCVSVSGTAVKKM